MKQQDDLLPGGKNDPFIVPDGFFEQFKTGVMNYADLKGDRQLLQFMKIAGKYAAILCILFFAGKGVVSTFAPDRPEENRYSVAGNEIDLIYMQVSERELTEYMVEELEEDLPYYTDF